MRSYNLALHRYGETSEDLRKLFEVKQRVEVTSLSLTTRLVVLWRDSLVQGLQAPEQDGMDWSGLRSCLMRRTLRRGSRRIAFSHSCVRTAALSDPPFVIGPIRPPQPLAEGEDTAAKMEVVAARARPPRSRREDREDPSVPQTTF